jgi:RHS repeat-associated protein
LYTGRELDTETGLMYYRARYYSTDVGGFVSRDPIQSSPSLYEYWGDNPMDATDPSGLFRQYLHPRYNTEQKCNPAKDRVKVEQLPSGLNRIISQVNQYNEGCQVWEKVNPRPQRCDPPKTIWMRVNGQRSCTETTTISLPGGTFLFMDCHNGTWERYAIEPNGTTETKVKKTCSECIDPRDPQNIA